MPIRNSRPRPGRPLQEQALDARSAIIAAACLNFARHGIRGSSNQQIAADAGVTAAMIHYYFKNRTALHLAVLEAGFTSLLRDLSGVKTLEHWVEYFHSHLSTHPWLPHLMIREVLTPSGLLRPLFMKQFAPQIFGFLRQLMLKTATGCKLRQDFDIDRHVVLLMAIVVYPFMSMEIGQNLTGRIYDKRMLEGFRDDAIKLFLKGITAK